MLVQILLIANLIARGEEEKKKFLLPQQKLKKPKKRTKPEAKKEEPKKEANAGEATASGNAPEVKTGQSKSHQVRLMLQNLRPTSKR